jgi:hypothetical protein
MESEILMPNNQSSNNRQFLKSSTTIFTRIPDNARSTSSWPERRNDVNLQFDLGIIDMFAQQNPPAESQRKKESEAHHLEVSIELRISLELYI